MAVKIFLIFVAVFASVEFLVASPTRRQYIAITEASVSDIPMTEDGTAWDDNDEFDLDGNGWLSQAVVSPSSIPETAGDFSEYDEDYSQGNVMVEFGGNDDEDEDDENDAQEAEEDEGSRNDSEFLFLPPKDTRLVLEDDDDDQSGPIKVRHTGRSSYPHVSDGEENSIESSDEDRSDNKQPFEFTIDEDKEEDIDDEDDDSLKVGEEEEDASIEELPRHESHDINDDEDDEFVLEDDDSENDMFDNPQEDAAQVIYGDHVFLY